MKKIITLLALLFFGQIQAQTWIAKYDSIYNWSLDTSALVWNPTNKEITFTYNANQNNIGFVDQTPSGSIWINFVRDTFAYNANNKISYQSGQTWSGTSWNNNSHNLFYYDANNNDTVTLRQVWNSGVWKDAMKWTYTYDLNNNRTVWLYQVTSGSAWTNQFLYTYTYDVNNNMDTTLSYHWNGAMWVLTQKNIYTYNINNYRTSNTTQTLSGGNWITQYQTLFSYDASNNLISLLNQSLSGSNWTTNSKVNYTYDSHNLMVTQEYRGFDSTGKIIQRDSTHYYFSALTGIESLSAIDNTIIVYPNPTTGTFTIKTSTTDKLTVDLYDVNGRHVFSKNVVGTADIDANSLDNGIYTLTIKNDLGIVNKKLVIAR